MHKDYFIEVMFPLFQAILSLHNIKKNMIPIVKMVYIGSFCYLLNLEARLTILLILLIENVQYFLISSISHFLSIDDQNP